MGFRWLWPWIAGSLCAVSVAGAETATRVLTLDEALALARDQGRAVLLAKGGIEEARARQVQAGRRFQENPVLEAEGGYRRVGSDFFDFETAVTQGLDAGGRRAARMAGARAAVERAEAELAEARRLLLREVRTAFARALAARERLALRTANRKAADALLAAVERRYEAGESTALELNRARIATAAARAEQSADEAAEGAARTGLRGLLGLREPVEIRGDLAPPPPPALERLLAGLAGRRPDLQALAAEAREAEAQVRLGEALARPGVGLRAGVAREERADIVRAGVVLTLPVHENGQETRAVGRARAAALRQALAAAETEAEMEVRGRHEILTGQWAAARELERTALPALEDNETLAGKGFEAGEIGLGELLLVRREILETRLAYLDRLLETALARFELETAAGALP
jgi:cobalt-zinc-cadmium efflux system outer membrane protein